MKQTIQGVLAGFTLQIRQLWRSPLLLFLIALQAITFIVLVHFFGLTGAFAPVAIIDNDHGYYAKAFIEQLGHTHHSFVPTLMDEATAQKAVKRGKIVAIIRIPAGFSEAIDLRETTPISVTVDNIDTDMTADIQRALPAAMSAFAKEYRFPGIHVTTQEHDVIDHDTGFISYMVVSAMGLIAFILAGTLSALVIAQTFENKKIALLRMSGTHPIYPLMGQLLGVVFVSFCILGVVVGIVVFGYGIVPRFPLELLLGMFMSLLAFGLFGAVIGIIIKRTLPVVTLFFGISLPLYLFSGTYEPERFDGNTIWILAHITPLYHVVGVFEHAVHNLRVTPESIPFNFIILLGWIVGLFAVFTLLLRKEQYA